MAFQRRSPGLGKGRHKPGRRRKRDEGGIAEGPDVWDKEKGDVGNQDTSNAWQVDADAVKDPIADLDEGQTVLQDIAPPAAPPTPSTSCTNQNQQPASIGAGDLNGPGFVGSRTTAPVAQNTWITTTVQEASSSGIVPIMTIGRTSTIPTASVSVVRESLNPSFSMNNSAALGAPTNGGAPSVPLMTPMEGMGSVSKAKTIAGISAGAILIVFLICLAVTAYTRGGAMRGLAFNIRLPALRSLRRASSVRQSDQNSPRIRPRSQDLENATDSSGSQLEDPVKDDGWDEYVKSMKNGDGVGKYNKEWVESWRRGEQRRSSIPRPPELQFNPDLPLPPISLDGDGDRKCAENK